MTQVHAQPVEDYRMRRARQLAEVRERNQRAAAVRGVNPDATDDEVDGLLGLWNDDNAEPDRAATGREQRRRRGGWLPRRPRAGADRQPSIEPTKDGAGASRTRAKKTSAGSKRTGRKERAAVPAELATIPAPGKSSRGVGRIRSFITRILLIVGPLLLVGGTALSCGVTMGSERLVTPGAITADEAASFHLTEFPADRAAAYGAAYVSLCLTHPDPKDTTAVDQRLAGLAAMTSAGVAEGCGWTGTTVDPAPLSVTWNGAATAIPGYSTGAAAKVGFTVVTAAGDTYTALVPVWVSSLDAAQSMKVVGDLAITPAVITAPAPAAPSAPVTDSALASTLITTVLTPFMQAWAASDSVQLGLVLAPNADGLARAGLAGQLTNPTVGDVQVVVGRGTPGEYRDGDKVTARLSVTWRSPAATQITGYEVGLTRVAGRWQVQTITGAAADPAGGAAPIPTVQTQPAIAG